MNKTTVLPGLVKLHVIQTFNEMLSNESREALSERLSACYASVLGEVQVDSMESGSQVIDYLTKGCSIRGVNTYFDKQAVIHRLGIELLSVEALRAEDESAAEHEAHALLRRYGLEKLSVESGSTDTAKLIGMVLLTLLNPVNYVKVALGKELSDPLFGKKKPTAAELKAAEPLDPNKVRYDTVAKLPKYMEDNFGEGVIESKEQVDGKVSAGGIADRLTWGKEFDEKNPLTFLKKKLSQYHTFYTAYAASVKKASDEVIRIDKETRKAFMEAHKAGDFKKADQIVTAAIKALDKIDYPVKVINSSNVVFPGHAAGVGYYNNPKGPWWCRTVTYNNVPIPKEIRSLTKEEARALLDLCKEAVLKLKEYTTIFNYAKWSDHSDGDEFWEILQYSNQGQYPFDEYAGAIYWQSRNQEFVDDVMDYSEIMAMVVQGVLMWIDRSFK